MSAQDTAAQLLNAAVLAAAGHGKRHHHGDHHNKFHIGGLQLIHFTGSQMADVLFALGVAMVLLILLSMAMPSRRRR